jgi:UDP-2,4-diacetamido-2,4,6-trideoxy-beta-L-altropyranose hydrolase
VNLSEKNVSLETLLIRADASVAIGTGHVMRCLALAQSWQDRGGKAVFAMAESPPSVCRRLLSEGMEVVPLEIQPGGREDARWLAELARQRAANWVVVDGYHFDADYQKELKIAGLRILFIDDNAHADHYAADIVLNQNLHAQNLHADENLYASRAPYTRLLLGSRYVLLRREFQSWRNWQRSIPASGRKILVSMGGSDPGNMTAILLPALRAISMEGLEVTVIAGGSNPHVESLERTIQASGAGFRLLKDVTDMPALMAWADVMLAAAGSICWEICAMALPALLLVTASNQTLAAHRLAAFGAVRLLDPGTETIEVACASSLQNIMESQDIRNNLSSNARELVDMDGSARVVSALQEVLQDSNGRSTR